MNATTVTHASLYISNVIFMGTRLQEEFSRGITAIATQAMEANVDIKLLVVLKDSKNETVVDSLRGDRVMWTLDHSFEYVEVDTTAPVKGYDEREKDGLPRVMEALHTNMWTSMQRLGTTEIALCNNGSRHILIFFIVVLVLFLDPSAKKSETSTAASSLPETVFSMPLLSPKESTDVPPTEVVSDDKTEPGKVELGYKGLLEDMDDDDKEWDKFNSTLQAVSLSTPLNNTCRYDGLHEQNVKRYLTVYLHL